MGTQAAPVRWLRVAVLRDGRIVGERRVRAGQPSGAADDLPIPGEPVRLFVQDGDGFVLRRVSGLDGKLRRGSQTLALASLPADGRDGDADRVRIVSGDRGKLSFRGLTLLFQVVDAAPATLPDFRAPLVRREDAPLYGFMVMFAAIGVMFTAYAQAAVPERITSADDLDERAWETIKSIPVVPAAVLKPVETPAPVPQGHATRVAKPARPSAGRGPGGPAGDGWKAHAWVLSGDAPGGRLIGDVDPDDATRALANGAKDDRVASLGGTKTGDGGGTGDVEIEDGGLIGVPEGKPTAGPDPRIHVDYDGPDVVTTGGTAGGDDVVQVVRKHNGQLRACYERELKDHPDLGGRVEVSWSLHHGRALDVHVEMDTTGDEALSACVAHAVESWQFAPALEGDVEYPFVFRVGR